MAASKISVASVSQGATKEGYLTKQGGSFKSWKKRWVVLKGDTLFYFKTPKDDDITGTIPLLEWSVAQEEGGVKKKHSFSVSSNKRTYLLYADTEASMRDWLRVINRSIDDKKPHGATSGGGGHTGGVGGSTSPPPSTTAPRTGGGTTPGYGGGDNTHGTDGHHGGGGGGGGMIGGGGGGGGGGATTKAPSASGASPRNQLAAARSAIPFLQEDDSKVLEFWQIWFESIPPREDISPGLGIDFHVSTSANMEKLTWRTGGPQNIFIQKMVDFFWNVGAPETEIDRLNDVGALINPFKIGSWIDMSAKGGMDGGWYFPVEIPLKLAIEAADPGDPPQLVIEWAEKHQVEKCYSVGRDMGAAPPRQTEFRVRLPGTDPEAQLEMALDAYNMFGFPQPPDEALRVLRSQLKDGLLLSIIVSSEGFVRLGMLSPKPSTDTMLRLCSMLGGSSEELAAFEGSLGVDGPAHVEFQYLKEGFGYGVYKEGFDCLFHYHAGEEGPLDA